MADETPKPLNLPPPLRKQKAVLAAWKPLLANWAVPGAGYWMIGQKGRAKAMFGVYVLFCALGYLQMKAGAGDGPVGGVYTPVLDPFQWMPTLGAAATAGIGPVYGIFAWAFGGSAAEPVRNLTQEYGASYVMVAGLLNWLCCFDIFDRVTGRWVWRLPKDEQEALSEANAKPAGDEA